MLQKYSEESATGSDGSATESFSQFDLRWMLSAALQHRWLMVIVPVILMVLASLFVVFRPASYLAYTQLELINLRLQFSREDAFFVETQPDPAFLETQLQVIRSDRVALSALTSLGVVNAESTPNERAEALETFRVRHSVDRAGQSNVVQINYSATDPELAARVANAVATGYIAELEAARLASAQSGSSWLRERLREVGPKARVIAEALPPHHKSNTRGILIIAAAGFFGGILAFAAALAWQILAGRVQTPEEVVAITGARCLGQFPRLPVRAARAAQLNKGPIWNTFSFDCPLKTFVMEHPGSSAWHAVRNAASACQDCFGGKGLRLIGITSTFTGEGRSTIAANLALHLAASNKSVLLVDADGFDPAFSALYGGSRPGLIDYLRSANEPLSQYAIVERRANLHLLPIGGDRGRKVDDIWTDGMRRFIQDAETVYDHVIFDLPTLSTNADLRAAARYIEGFLLVVGWQQVSPQNLRLGLEALAPVQDKLVGTILNNVNLAKARWTLSPQTEFSSQVALTDPYPRRDIGAHSTASSQRTTWVRKMFHSAFPQPPPPPRLTVRLAPNQAPNSANLDPRGRKFSMNE